MTIFQFLRENCTEKGIVPGARVKFKGQVSDIPKEGRGFEYQYFLGNEKILLNNILVYEDNEYAEVIDVNIKVDKQEVVKVYLDHETGEITDKIESDDYEEYFLVPKSKHGDFPDLSGFHSDYAHFLHFTDGVDYDEVIAEFTDSDGESRFLTLKGGVATDIGGVGEPEKVKKEISMEDLFVRAGLDINDYNVI